VYLFNNMHHVPKDATLWLLLLPVAVLISVVTADALVPFSSIHWHKTHQQQQLRQRVTRQPQQPCCSISPSLLKLSEKNDAIDDENVIRDDGNPVLEAKDQKDAVDSSIPRGGGGGGGVISVHQPPPALPTLADYRKFALPCLGLWVSQPLLSLVDTAFVGLSSGGSSTATTISSSAANLAALGPATTFFDGATYLFAFLNVATTNLYSTARAKHGSTSPQAQSIVQAATRVAFRCGVGLMIFLLAFARPLLALYIGKQ
jgi:hypothetical protein